MLPVHDPSPQQVMNGIASIHRKGSRVRKLARKFFKLFHEIRKRVTVYLKICQLGNFKTMIPFSGTAFQQRHRYQQQLQTKQQLRRLIFAGFVASIACFIALLTIYFCLTWLFAGMVQIMDILRKLEGEDAFHMLTTDHTNYHRREAVREAFLHAWNGYEKYAFGHDEIRPVSNITNDSWGGWGVTMIDALDTIILMGYPNLLDKCEDHISRLDFVRSKPISVFETTIRYLGGLISAYDLTGKKIYLEKAVELSEKLAPAFDSPSKLAYHETNTKTGKSENAQWVAGAGILSEVGSVQLEFKRLAKITSNQALYDHMSNNIKLLQKRQWEAHEEYLEKLPIGLYPVKASTDDGRFNPSAKVTFGGLGDSFYEYLLKQYLLTDQTEHEYLEWYIHSIESLTKYLSHTVQYNNETYYFITEMSMGTQVMVFEHLTCFVPGMIILGTSQIRNTTLYTQSMRAQHLKFAREILRTCVMLYDSQATGIAPDSVQFQENGFSITNPSYYLRPETIESLFYFHRITGQKSYAEDGWRIFQNLVKHCRTPSAFSGLKDVTKVPAEQNNSMQSFFLAETLKYFYLLFSDVSILPLDRYVFNTEGHPFKIEKMN